MPKIPQNAFPDILQQLWSRDEDSDCISPPAAAPWQALREPHMGVYQSFLIKNHGKIFITPSWSCLCHGVTETLKINVTFKCCFVFPHFICLSICRFRMVGVHTKRRSLQAFHRAALDVYSTIQRSCSTYPPLRPKGSPQCFHSHGTVFSSPFSPTGAEKARAGWKNPRSVKGREWCLAGFHPSKFMCHHFGCINLSELSRRLL